jgi:hypothetical protein
MVAQILGYFFYSKSFDKKWLGIHFGQFFHNLVTLQLNWLPPVPL